MPISKSPIVLANNTTLKIDGAGAQLQRLVSILALSKKLKIDFHQNAFVDISVHPLDPFQDPKGKEDFIGQMNNLFKIDIDGNHANCKSLDVETLSSWRLLVIAIRHIHRRNTLVLNIVEPYPITDVFPDITRAVQNSFPRWTSFVDNLVKDLNRPLISVHYRQGVGGLAIYPGQKIPRELPPDYFYSKLQNLPITNREKIEFHLFTDAPVDDIIYSPQTEQREHWEGTPGFTDGLMQVNGKDLYSFFREKGLDSHVHIGGNPLEAIAIMSRSDFLITSRSSLSYIAGLLNLTGTVVAADDFWHPAPRDWITS